MVNVFKVCFIQNNTIHNSINNIYRLINLLCTLNKISHWLLLPVFFSIVIFLKII